MKKEIALVATAALTVATLAVGNTLAFFTDQGKADNVVTMGNVSITLTEPQFQNTTSGSYSAEFMPGDVITKDPTVTNVGENDAYVRCTISIEKGSSTDKGLNEEEQKELLQNLDMNANDWVLSNDGYYYYQKILPKASSGSVNTAELFHAMTIPTAWGSSGYPMDNAHFKIAISAEAVQADNFTPTKNGSGKIIAWDDSSGSPVSAVSSAVSSPLTVSYTGNGSTKAVQVENAEDLDAFRGLMPGGNTQPQNLVIKNRSSQKMAVYFRAQPTDSTSAELLNALRLTVTFKMDDGSVVQTLYNGPASGKTGTASVKDIVSSPIRLGYVYGNSTSGVISAVLSAPATMGNEYQSAQADIQWVIQFELTSGGGGGRGGGGGGNAGGSTTVSTLPISSVPPESIGEESTPLTGISSASSPQQPSGSSSTDEEVPDNGVPLSSPPKTGQDGILPAIVCAGAVLSLLVFLIARRKAE